jgi:3-dehydroquinate synthase
MLDALGEGRAESLVLPAGEAHKSIDGWRTVIDRLVAIEALRDATLVALGGGVVGDLTGFAAACYMRGIRYIQVPTTLLAQVDASVGGKTAINHSAGKNLVGAFHQPAAVVIDSDTLASLGDREFNAGMAEVVKYGAIRDPEFFSWLEAQIDAIAARDADTVRALIARSIRNKAEVVVEDERESGIRAILNFGHSFAHALEALTGYTRFLHGEAVSIGMVAAAKLSELRGICPAGRTARLQSLLKRFGLPVAWPADVSPARAWEAMAMDKKAVSAGLRLILLEDIGKAVIDQGCDRRDIVRVIESRVESGA